jgi:hypothetical protein
VATGGAVDAGSPNASGVERVILLVGELVTIGSAETQQIRVPGAAPQAAEIRWIADGDEWVFNDVTGGRTLIDGARGAGWALHHGDRMAVADVTFVFQRDEWADHGSGAASG